MSGGPPSRSVLLVSGAIAVVIALLTVLPARAGAGLLTAGRGGAVAALIFGGAAAATVAVAGVHAIRHRSALQWCAPGAALSLIGLSAFTIGQDFTDQPNATIATIAAGLASTVAAGLM